MRMTRLQQRISKKAPWNRYPYRALFAWVIAEHSYCEQRVHLWLRDPGERISVPRQLQGSEAAAVIEIAAASGRASHESLSELATPISALDLPILRQSGALFSLTECPFQASFRTLPIVGTPDVLVCQGNVALLIIDYKFTRQTQLAMSHRVQLYTYGYLIQEHGFDVSNLKLACVLAPPETSKSWSISSHELIDSIHNHIRLRAAQYPAAKNWRSNSLRFNNHSFVLRAFPYSRERAERELSFVADYWLGQRPPFPTSQPAKCSSCLYNMLRQCRSACARFAPVKPTPPALANV